MFRALLQLGVGDDGGGGGGGGEARGRVDHRCALEVSTEIHGATNLPEVFNKMPEYV